MDDWIQEVEEARHKAGLLYDSGRRFLGRSHSCNLIIRKLRSCGTAPWARGDRNHVYLIWTRRPFNPARSVPRTVSHIRR
jgi:hypothetical protein